MEFLVVIKVYTKCLSNLVGVGCKYVTLHVISNNVFVIE